MLSVACILFVIIASQPSRNYLGARFVFVFLRYVHEKKFENIDSAKVNLKPAPLFEYTKVPSPDGASVVLFLNLRDSEP